MPAIIIHSLDHAVAALNNLAQAVTEDPEEVFLLSPRGAAATMGAAVFQAIINEAREQVPGCAFTAVLDCGEEPGYALAAIRAGVKAIVFTGNKTAAERISDIAQQNNCQMIDSEVYAIAINTAPEYSSDAAI